MLEKKGKMREKVRITPRASKAGSQPLDSQTWSRTYRVKKKVKSP